jgi:hypothetical protein
MYHAIWEATEINSGFLSRIELSKKPEKFLSKVDKLWLASFIGSNTSNTPSSYRAYTFEP